MSHVVTLNTDQPSTKGSLASRARPWRCGTSRAGIGVKRSPFTAPSTAASARQILRGAPPATGGHRRDTSLFGRLRPAPVLGFRSGRRTDGHEALGCATRAKTPPPTGSGRTGAAASAETEPFSSPISYQLVSSASRNRSRQRSANRRQAIRSPLRRRAVVVGVVGMAERGTPVAVDEEPAPSHVATASVEVTVRSALARCRLHRPSGCDSPHRRVAGERPRHASCAPGWRGARRPGCVEQRLEVAPAVVGRPHLDVAQARAGGELEAGGTAFTWLKLISSPGRLARTAREEGGVGGPHVNRLAACVEGLRG